MLNTLASYFWGSSADNESDARETPEYSCGSREHLETQQVEDWVVVRTAGEAALDEQVEPENEVAREQPEMNEQLQNEQAQIQADVIALQQRNVHLHASVHPGFISAQQLVKNIHLAHRLQYMEGQKLISRSKCEYQNKVREHHSHRKGNNRRNKTIRPSGFRSSRFSQRF